MRKSHKRPDRHRPCRRTAALIDHEHDLRDDARRFLLHSGSSIAAYCGHLDGMRAALLVRAWETMLASQDAAPDRWPVAELLCLLESCALAGGVPAARLTARLRDIRAGVDRLATLEWLTKDPVFQDAYFQTDA